MKDDGTAKRPHKVTNAWPKLGQIRPNATKSLGQIGTNCPKSTEMLLHSRDKLSQRPGQTVPEAGTNCPNADKPLKIL